MPITWSMVTNERFSSWCEILMTRIVQFAVVYTWEVPPHDSSPMCVHTPPASLIELLAELLDAEQSLFGKKVRPVEDWLKRYLKSGFILRYERRKEIAADETFQSRQAHPFVITPTLVSQRLSGLWPGVGYTTIHCMLNGEATCISLARPVVHSILHGWHWNCMLYLCTPPYGTKWSYLCIIRAAFRISYKGGQNNHLVISGGAKYVLNGGIMYC